MSLPDRLQYSRQFLCPASYVGDPSSHLLHLTPPGPAHRVIDGVSIEDFDDLPDEIEEQSLHLAVGRFRRRSRILIERAAFVSPLQNYRIRIRATAGDHEQFAGRK